MKLEQKCIIFCCFFEERSVGLKNFAIRNARDTFHGGWIRTLAPRSKKRVEVFRIFFYIFFFDANLRDASPTRRDHGARAYRWLVRHRTDILQRQLQLFPKFLEFDPKMGKPGQLSPLPGSAPTRHAENFSLIFKI